MKILVTGSASGLGAALVAVLREQDHDVFEYDAVDGHDVREPDALTQTDWYQRIGLDTDDSLDVLINCAGINGIDWLENLEEGMWDDVMGINAKGIYKMSQFWLHNLAAAKGTIINIVSNAAHMPMTCSLAYNASKAAAHIMTLQMAHELTRKHGITVFGVAPNRMSGTQMSAHIDERVVETRGWTPEFAREYQMKGLLAGEETPPRAVAEFIGYLLTSKDHHRYLSGCILPYGK